MIGLIEGQLYDLTPLVVTNAEFTLGINEKGNVEAYIGEKRIDYGVFYRSFNKSVDIHPKTGEITINYPGKARIRGIFGDFHRDIEIGVTASHSDTSPSA